tara:strand:+ start:1640 stop:2431 length:792 start_codon:yes stop_codon:yes gene_type:complete
MLFDTNNVLKMDERNLLKLISTSKYVGYRLGDIVLNYPCERKAHIETCYKPQKQKFPQSLAIQYTEIYKGPVSLGLKIGKHENIDYNISILLKLCDEISIKDKPTHDDLVATIRLGDMIEQNKEKRSGFEVAKLGGTFYTPNGGLRYILSAKQIMDKAKELNTTNIILVGSKANGTGIQSVYYLKTIMILLQQHGLNVKWYYSHSPDEDLVYISHARNLLEGPGGFCLIGKAISNFRFHKYEAINPTPNAVNFFHFHNDFLRN